MRARIAAAAAILCATTAAPAAADAATSRTETATSGAISATLTYTLHAPQQASAVTLAIARAAAPATVARHGMVAAGCRACTGAVPVAAIDGGEPPSLSVVDLQGDGEPEVVVDLYTGGAHCCSISAIYGWDAASGSYGRLIHDWGDPGSSLEDLAGPGLELVSADDRFAYAFCAYACSAMPPRIYRYRDASLVDVTRQFPARVRSSLRDLRATVRQLARHRDQRTGIRGILPAICADLAMLGRGSQCRPLLRDARARGWLDKAPPWKAGSAYVSDVRRSLRRWGYR
jgi:hypothetical protein